MRCTNRIWSDWAVAPPVAVAPLLRAVLDWGEAAVMALAQSSGVNVGRINARKARKIARHIYGLQVMGSARVLVEVQR